MAVRYVYVPTAGSAGVQSLELEFDWFPGFAVSQKQKSIASLHLAAKKKGIQPVLEISSKSENELGVKLSAFNLSFKLKSSGQEVTVESAFQGSKVFSQAGPFFEFYKLSARDAKREVRLRQRGALVKFNFFGRDFPLRPRTFFYDWLYVKTLHTHDELAAQICQFQGFSDIEFNPEKSINCQAFSAALYVSLKRNDLLTEALASEASFHNTLRDFYEERERKSPLQQSFL